MRGHEISSAAPKSDRGLIRVSPPTSAAPVGEGCAGGRPAAAIAAAAAARSGETAAAAAPPADVAASPAAEGFQELASRARCEFGDERSGGARRGGDGGV